jgi:glycosyltransferase involved in cell wall biosynthesis
LQFFLHVDTTPDMRVTLAHHWLTTLRGGEKVLEQFCLLFPDAPIQTLVATPDFPSEIVTRHPIHQTILGRWAWARQRYRHFLPLYPLLLQTLAVDADLLISSDASLIKGIRKTPRTRHVCYCYSPPRYLWDVQDDYLQSMDRLTGVMLKLCTGYLRAFDRRAAQRVDRFIAISDFVAQRISMAYDRDSVVVYPPVDTTFYVPGGSRESFYLVVSALTAYKRIDLAVQAFNRLGKPLVIIGDGPERARLEAMAAKNIHFIGSRPDAILRDHYQRCTALIFPGIEDFGITPLEAQACGRPVIALARGGALETVIHKQTGLFFALPLPEAIEETVLRMEREADLFDPAVCRENALRFGQEVFRERMREVLEEVMPGLF